MKKIPRYRQPAIERTRSDGYKAMKAAETRCKRERVSRQRDHAKREAHKRQQGRKKHR